MRRPRSGRNRLAAGWFRSDTPRPARWTSWTPLARQPQGAILRTVSDRQSVDVLVGSIEPERLYQPISINAAVYDSDGDAALVLCVVDAAEPITGRRVVELGALVRDAAAELTGLICGRHPEI